MPKKPGDQIAKLIRDVEKSAKQLRNDIRKQLKVTPRDLDRAAGRLRKGAADVARQVEKYVRDIRVELERRAKPAPKKKAARRGGGSTARRKKTSTERA